MERFEKSVLPNNFHIGRNITGFLKVVNREFSTAISTRGVARNIKGGGSARRIQCSKTVTEG